MTVLGELALLLRNYPELEPLREKLLQAYQMLEACFSSGGKALLCGNGGSAADCEHMTGELLKGFKLRREIPRNLDFSKLEETEAETFYQKLQGGLPAISLTGQLGYFTAWCNDADPDLVYAQQVYTLGRKRDILVAFSTSGNSANIVNAVAIARAKGVRTLGLTGSGACRMAELCDGCIQVPAYETFRVQEYHLPVYHALCAMLEQHFFGKELVT